MTCSRSVYFFRKKYKPDNNKILKNKIDIDNFKEVSKIYEFDEIQKIITSEKFKLKCHVDAIKDNIFIELKYIDSNKFNGNYLDLDYKHSLISSYILNNEYDYSIKSIQIIYFIRTLNNIYKFDLKLNKQKSLIYLNDSLILMNCLEENKIPEIFNKIKNQCEKCPYINYCKKELKNKSIFLL